MIVSLSLWSTITKFFFNLVLLLKLITLLLFLIIFRVFAVLVVLTVWVKKLLISYLYFVFFGLSFTLLFFIYTYCSSSSSNICEISLAIVWRGIIFFSSAIFLILLSLFLLLFLLFDKGFYIEDEKYSLFTWCFGEFIKLLLLLLLKVLTEVFRAWIWRPGSLFWEGKNLLFWLSENLENVDGPIVLVNKEEDAQFYGRCVKEYRS